MFARGQMAILGISAMRSATSRQLGRSQSAPLQACGGAASNELQAMLRLLCRKFLAHVNTARIVYQTCLYGSLALFAMVASVLRAGPSEAIVNPPSWRVGAAGQAPAAMTG